MNPSDREKPLTQGNGFILKTVLSLSAITILAKVFGFGEKIVIAHFWGTSEVADTYFAMMGIFFSIIFLIKELIYPSLLPTFSSTLQMFESASGNLFKKIFLTVIGILVIGGIFFSIFAPLFTQTLVPGFSPSQQKTIVFLLRTLVPGICFLGLTTITYTVLNAQGKFLISALGDLLFKFMILLGYTAFIPFLGINSIPLVIGGTAFVCLFFHLCFIKEHKYLFKRVDFNNNESFKKVFRLMAPLILGVVFSHISDIVDNLLASKLPTGQLSYLNYAKKLTDAFLLIGPVAIVTVVYSRLSNLFNSQQQEEARELFLKTLRALLYIAVPAACILITLRHPLLQCLFQHGQFNAVSTAGTAQVLIIYAMGLITFSLDALFVYTFYSLSNTKTPVTFGIICVILNVVLAIWLSRSLGYIGIALALVLVKTIKVFILGRDLDKRIQWVNQTGLMGFLIKLSAATLLQWLVLNLFAPAISTDSVLSTAVFRVALPSLAGILVFALCSYILRMEEVSIILRLAIKKKQILEIK